MDSSFRQYKVYVGISRGSLERRRQTTMGSRVSQRSTVACILHIRCLRNKLAGHCTYVGVGHYGDRK